MAWPIQRGRRKSVVVTILFDIHDALSHMLLALCLLQIRASSMISCLCSARKLPLKITSPARCHGCDGMQGKAPLRGPSSANHPTSSSGVNASRFCELERILQSPFSVTAIMPGQNDRLNHCSLEKSPSLQLTAKSVNRFESMNCSEFRQLRIAGLASKLNVSTRY